MNNKKLDTYQLILELMCIRDRISSKPTSQCRPLIYQALINSFPWIRIKYEKYRKGKILLTKSPFSHSKPSHRE